MNNVTLLNSNEHLETTAVFRAIADTEAKLGELRGTLAVLPNESMIANTLPLQEAKASSEIEGIVITHDELYRSFADSQVNGTAREVRAYYDSLLSSFTSLQKRQIISLNDILAIQEQIIKNNAGLRTTKGNCSQKQPRRDCLHPSWPPTLRRFDEQLSQVHQR